MSYLTYQHVFHEITGIDPGVMNNYSNADSIAAITGTDQIIQEYREQLLAEVHKLFTQLTPHQQTVINLLLDGYTQTEIAKTLGSTQPAIHKAIHGNVDYSNGGKVYGGAVIKLQKLSRSNPRILALLECIEIYKSTGIKHPVIEKPVPCINTDRIRKYVVNESGRQCIRCKVYKTWTNFYADKASKYGKGNLCRVCGRIKASDRKTKKLVQKSP